MEFFKNICELNSSVSSSQKDSFHFSFLNLLLIVTVRAVLSSEYVLYIFHEEFIFLVFELPCECMSIVNLVI
jgi:hypothetical protein